MRKKQFNIRLDAELRERVEKIIAESKGQYRSLAHYIELAVAEKVDRKEEEKR
jgi:predicted transcriptional regulator